MATEKDIAFALYMIKLTKEGKLKWEATAGPAEFTASLKGKYTVVIGRPSSIIRYATDTEYYFKLIDQSGQELIRLTEEDYREVVQLFDLARRTSLNVDAIIDEILGEE